MRIGNGANLNLNAVGVKKPVNFAQKAEELAGPDSQATQMAKNTVKSNQTFQFKDSVTSKDEQAMIKQIMQQLVAEALVSNAAIIRSSHENKGNREESAK